MASEQFSLCWDNFHKNMSSGMNSLLESEDLVDVTLAVEGKLLKAHKMVLSVCSPYFKELFKSNPCQHPIVFMKDVSYVAISDLLQFMYQGEVQVSQDNLTTFIKTAEALQIKGLTGDGNDSNNADPEPVLEKPSPRHVEEYKPSPRPKKQVPAPVVTTTPAPKRPRLSVSSNDSQSAPAPITKTEPVSAPASGSDSVQFKVEPYDQNQSVTIPDDNDDNFGDDTLDDNLADDNEDYSMMEGEEPQAGTSTDGTGEGQAFRTNTTKHLKTILNNQRIMLQRQANFTRSLNSLTSLINNHFNENVLPASTIASTIAPTISSTNVLSFEPEKQLIEPINSLKKLQEFEQNLKDENYMKGIVERMAVVCGRSGNANGIDSCYKLIDCFLTRSFVTQCSWTGNTRLGPGIEKIPLKVFANFRKCFMNIILLADSAFSETQCDSFFKLIMRNSVKRNRMVVRASTHKKRPKNLTYNINKKNRYANIGYDIKQECSTEDNYENDTENSMVNLDTSGGYSDDDTVEEM